MVPLMNEYRPGRMRWLYLESKNGRDAGISKGEIRIVPS
jgi:hypothetical protein